MAKKLTVANRQLLQQATQDKDIQELQCIIDGYRTFTEEYLAYYANKTSEYMLLLEKVKRNTELKLRMGHYKELLQIVNDIDTRLERQALMEKFDNIFLKLFPGFIEEFNSLLKPEDQIRPKNSKVLNTHLRIFALMRLGIKDNQAIADILESSVSTVYTYKFRTRSKSQLQSEVFENKIMDISNFDKTPEQTLSNPTLVYVKDQN